MAALVILLFVAAVLLVYAAVSYLWGPDPDLGDKPWFPEGHWRR